MSNPHQHRHEHSHAVEHTPSGYPKMDLGGSRLAYHGHLSTTDGELRALLNKARRYLECSPLEGVMAVVDEIDLVLGEGG